MFQRLFLVPEQGPKNKGPLNLRQHFTASHDTGTEVADTFTDNLTLLAVGNPILLLTFFSNSHPSHAL
jgi:hypothetical protein